MSAGGLDQDRIAAALADALAKAAGKDYRELLHDRVTGPLGRADTAVRPSKEQCDRLMTGSGLGGPGRLKDQFIARK